MPSLGGITEIIGIRAEIIGIRQYLADGRQIESVNERIAQSTKKLESVNASLAASETAKRAATLKANQDFLAASNARQKVLRIEQQLAAATKAASGGTGLVGANGLPISGAAATQAAADVTRLQKELKQAKTEFDSLASAAVAAGRVEKTATTSFLSLSAQRNAALRQEAKLEGELAAARSSRFKAATTVAAITGTAIVGGIAAGAISSAAKYQQELSKINVLTSATDAETQQLGQSFLKLSGEIPVSASDLAASAYKLLSSGIKDTGEALNITTGAAKAAVAGQADIKDIISATVSVLNGYPKGAITAAQVNDLLFAGVKEGSAEFNDFAGAIGKVIPIAAAMNVPFDQLVAAMAVLTNGGLNAEEAMTGLRAILNDLAKDENSKQAQEALKGFGLTVSDVRKKIRDEGLPQAMGELITLFNGNLAAIEPLIPNIRGMVAAFSAFQDNGKTTIGVLQSIDNAGGIVDQSFAKTKDNVANLAQIFKNQLNVAFIEIGNAVLPSVTEALKDLNKWISDNKEDIAKFVAEGLQGIINVGKDVAQGIGIIAGALDDLDGKLKSIVGQSDLTKVALAGIGAALVWALPGGPIIVGLITITTLLAELTKPGGFSDRAADKINDALGLGSKGKDTLSPDLIRQHSGSGSIESGVRDIFKNTPESFKNDIINNTLKTLEKQGIDTSKGVEELDKAIKKTDDTTKPLSNITLPKLNNSVEGVDQNAKKAAEDLKKLAEEFQKSSEAAGQVESLTEKLKLFGEITPEIAKGFGLDAVQAGNVQGVDAVARATERATNRAFEFTKALATVAEAFQQAGSDAVRAVNEMVQGIASAALSASQSALSDLLSQPTREQANLGVNLAFQNQRTTNLEFRNQPAINALKEQLRNIDRQMASLNRQNAAANRAAERAKRDQERANREQQRQQQAAVDAAERQIDAIKFANLQAQIAAERQLDAIQKLIDANNKAASDLQEAFLKNNNDLQQQINTAIGKGDSATALQLVEQQRTATKQYRDQSKALQKNNQELTLQQKAAQEAEKERQRQVQLQEAQLEQQKKQIESQKKLNDNTDDLSQSIDDNKEAQDAQTQALQDQKDKIQEQIDALQDPIDKSKQQADGIQRAIDLYKSQADVLKAQAVQADHTLKTQEQQWQSAKKLITQIDIESGAVKKYSDLLKIDTIPTINDANEKFKLLQGVLKTITDPNFRQSLIAKNFDPAGELKKIFATAAGDMVKAVQDAAKKPPTPGQLGKETQNVTGQNEAFQHNQTEPNVGGITDEVLRKAGLLKDIISSIKPPNVGDAGLKVIDDSTTAAENLGTTLDNQVNPPDVGDAGLLSIQTSTTAAENLGNTLALQVQPPDIGDAGNQTLINATSSAQTLGFVIGNEIRKPDIGDAGRQTILDATQAARGLGTILNSVGQQIKALGDKIASVIKQSSSINLNTVSKNLPKFMAQGGVFTQATLGIVGEAGPEVVLPLSDVNRIAQVLKQASAVAPGTAVGTTSSGVLSSYQINASVFGNVASGYDSINTGIMGATGSGPGSGGSSSPVGLPYGDPRRVTFGLANAEEAAQIAYQLAFGKHWMPGDKVGLSTTAGNGTGINASFSSVAASNPAPIVAQLSPQLTAQLATAAKSTAVFAPNINVTGETLDTMEATALKAVRDAFSQARNVSSRSGGLITQGLGPNH